MMSGPFELSVTCAGPVLLPCFNRWGEDIYLQAGDFSLDPVAVPAASTAGSPVLLADGLFVGLLSPVPGAVFQRRDDQLTITSPVELFVREREPFEAWTEYSRLVLGEGWRAGRTAEFHDTVEYCTWVEQKAAGAQAGTGPQEQLTDSFLGDFLDRIDQMGLPRGKVTIDDGWAPSNAPAGVGDWGPHPSRMKDLAAAAAKIKARGHVPGLWFAPGRVAVESNYFRHNHDMTFPVEGRAAETTGRAAEERYLYASASLLDHYRAIFAEYADMGFAKFKLDLHYGPKHQMAAQLQLAYAAIKELDPSFEVEHHVPDIFASRWADVVRTNDVLISADKLWRALAEAHWFISRWSAPDTVLNLDHIGGNDESVGATDFVAHWDMMRQQAGHPVVGLLPDRFGAATVNRLRADLAAYDAGRSPTWSPPVPLSWQQYLLERKETS